MSLLEVVDLKTDIRLRTSTVHAVDGISFVVAPGETVGIVGESGCGKTMTGMSIMQLLPKGGHVVGGAINFDGRDLLRLSDAQLRQVRGNDIGIVFQDPMTSLNPTMTIGRQIAESVRLHKGASKQAAAARAVEVLDLVGMPRPKERVDDYPHQLSGGLRQRVMIAIALACEPKLLIADEPTTALDVTIQAQILALLDDLKSRLGMAMILITHDMGVIAGRADRVVVMYAGRKVEMADTGELFSHMRHPYTEALLASIPQIDQDKTQRLYSIPGLPPDLSNPPSCCRFAARCAFATERCRTEDPTLDESDLSHPFACFHPRQAADKDVVERAASLIAAAAENSELSRRFSDDLKLMDLEGTDGTTAEQLAEEAREHGDAPVAPDVDGDAILRFVGISKSFPVTAGSVLKRKVGDLQAVTDVDLTVRRGETFGLVGESGCGKTTLGRMAVAMEAPTKGQILFNGVDLAGLKGKALREQRRELQLMFQDPYASLDPRMRVKEIIAEPLVVARRGSSAEREQAVRDLLEQVGLAQRAMERYPHEFSGGQRQRVGLARALALNPQVIVADEPVSALDVSIRSQILNLMKRLQASHNLTYIVISHDLSVIRYLADRIGVMYLGKLVEIGTGEDIYARPAHPYTSGLLTTIPVPNPEVERAKTSKAIMRGELPSPVHPPSGCRFRTRCPRAQERCAEEVPELRAFGGEHRAACHFPLEQPVPLTAAPAAAAER